MSEVITFNTEKNESYTNPLERQPIRKDSLLDNLLYYQNVVDHKVTGWFYPLDNAIIFNIMNKIQTDISGDVCEIGVAYGKSAIALSNYKLENDNLYLYEIFNEESKVFAENNIKAYGTFENVTWRLQDTTTLNKDTVKFTSPLRLLHIDGCHEHVAVYKDLALFTQKMTDKGVIVLDDFNDPEYPGVNAGCMEFLSKNPEWVIFAIGQNKCYICKAKYHNFYVKELVEILDQNKQDHNLPFKFVLRQMFNTNALLCCSRSDWSKDEVLSNMNEAPIIQ